MKIFFTIALRNVWKNWKHSLASIISISAGFVSFSLFQGYMVDVENTYYDSFRYRSMYGDFFIENPALHTADGRENPEKFHIPEDHQKLISNYLDQEKTKIHASVRFLTATGMITNGKNSSIFLAEGYDLEEGAKALRHWEWNTTFGKPLHRVSEPQGAALGQGLGALLGCFPEDSSIVLVQNKSYPPVDRPFHCERNALQLTATTESGQLNALDLSVVGLTDVGYKDIDNKWIITSIQNMQTLLNTKKIRFLTVQLKDHIDARSFLSKMNNWFQGQNLPERILRWQDHPSADTYRKTMSLLEIFKSFIIVVIITISSLSVLNTMIKIVKERTKEIGTLRSLGFESNQVRLIFSLEAFFLSLIGTGIGLALALFLATTINNVGIVYKAGMLSQPVQFQIAYDLWTYAQAFLFLVVIATLTGFLSCRSVVKNQITENLTYA